METRTVQGVIVWTATFELPVTITVTKGGGLTLDNEMEAASLDELVDKLRADDSEYLRDADLTCAHIESIRTSHSSAYDFDALADEIANVFNGRVI